MSKAFITYQVKSSGINEDFETCDTCKHAEDDITLCQLRLCVHAFHEMKECYEEKTTERIK